MLPIVLYESGHSAGGMFDHFVGDGDFFHEESKAINAARSKHGNYAKTRSINAIEIDGILHRISIHEGIQEGRIKQ